MRPSRIFINIPEAPSTGNWVELPRELQPGFDKPNVKPTVPFVFDKSHKFAKYVKFFTLLDPSDGYRDLISGAKPTITGTPTFKGTPLGLAVDFDKSTFFEYSTPLPIDANTPIASVIQTLNDELARPETTDIRHHFSILHSTDDKNSQRMADRYWVGDVDFYASKTGFVLINKDIPMSTFGMHTNGLGTLDSVYLNGILKGTDITALATSAETGNPRLKISDSVSDLPVGSYMYLTGADLTAEIVQEITRDMYQLLKPAVPLRYFMPVAGAVATPGFWTELPKSMQPGFTNPKALPSVPVEIDRSNKLGANAFVAILGNGDGRDIISGTKGTLVGSPAGGFIDLTGTGDYLDFPNINLPINQKFLIHIKFQIITASGENRIFSSKVSFNHTLGMEFARHNTDTGLWRFWLRDAATHVPAIVDTQTSLVSMTISYDGSGGLATFESVGTDGFVQKSSSSGTNLAISTSGFTIGEDADQTSSNGRLKLHHFTFIEGLDSEADARALHSNPYQIYKPKVPLQYFMPVAEVISAPTPGHWFELPKHMQPGFTEPGVRPTVPVEIDTSDPFVRQSLQRAYLFEPSLIDYMRKTRADLLGTLNTQYFDGHGWTQTATTLTNHAYIDTGWTQTNAGTVLVDLTFNSIYDFNAIFDNSAHDNDCEMWVYGDGRLSARMDQSLETITRETTGTIVAGSRHVVAYRWDDSEAASDSRLFIDGVLRNSQTGAATTATKGSLLIAGGHASNDGGANTFHGMLIYEEGLSDTEILNISKNFYRTYKPQVPLQYFVPDGAAPSGFIPAWVRKQFHIFGSGLR